MMKDGGETPRGVATVILEAIESVAPRFRHQSSSAASAMAAHKIVDTSGESIVQATRVLLG